MNSGLIARRYATVLFDYARERGIEDGVYEDTRNIREALSVSAEAMAFVCSPVRKPSEKKRLIEQVFSQVVKAETIQFLNFVIDKDRAVMLCEILRVYGVVYKEHKGIRTAVVTTAKVTESHMQERIKQLLEEKLGAVVEASFKDDPSLIGGVIVEVDGRQIDTSIKRQLIDIEKQLAV
ncbi:MAG: ATP synthase F1 subunit delta [Marinilabiliaceae bacterium]|nr:ATP synthase F1 subunit delta [Marinilabiliaceae bacterium]